MPLRVPILQRGTLLMLDKPDYPDAEIIAFLAEHHPFTATQLTFLPLGFDPNAAAYRADTAEGQRYFVKFKRGAFDEMTLLVPHFLREQQIEAVIAPIPARSGELRVRFHEYNVMIYPFVEAQNGFVTPLSPHNWQQLGAVMRGMHSANIPPALRQRLRRESYTPYWRDVVRNYQARIRGEKAADEMAALVQHWPSEIDYLVRQAERLGTMLVANPPPEVLCHADLHAGNVLIDTAGELFVVDWDDTLLAPKERDLMFVGAGIGGVWDRAEEAIWFSDGYGATAIDPIPLVYYLHERIVQDIAVTIIEIEKGQHSAENRAAELQAVADQFGPGRVVDIARQTAARYGMQD